MFQESVSAKAHLQWAKVKAKAKHFFDVCRLFYDFWAYSFASYFALCENAFVFTLLPYSYQAKE